MAEVRWTQQAADDLESITDFISQDSPCYARLFATDIINVVERLSNFSNLGRMVPEINDPIIREIIFGNFRIAYRLKSKVVELLTIHHSAGLLDPLKLG